MNYIDKIRADIYKEFHEKDFQKWDVKSGISPSGEFRLEATFWGSKTSNLEVTKIEIYEQLSDVKLFDFFVNDSFFSHGWLTANSIQYLICAEDIFGGQTIIDLTNRSMASYSPGEDGFIWTDFHLSPDGKTLATIGCYWACPYILKLFDFADPLTLPLREIKQIELLDDDEVILGWANNKNLKMKGISREREPEDLENGSFRMKTISETKVEREIKIEL